MSKGRIDKKQREILTRIWNEVNKKMEITFMVVLDFHVYKVKGEHAKNLFIEYPEKFKEAFVLIFGHGVWKLFEKILRDICIKNNIDCDSVLYLFNRNELPF